MYIHNLIHKISYFYTQTHTHTYIHKILGQVLSLFSFYESLYQLSFTHFKYTPCEVL